MRLTSRGRNAVAAMVEVARRTENGPVSLREVSVSQGISLSYLEPMFSIFRKHGLVQSTRGPGGGYSLGRDASEITIADIVKSLNEDIYPVPESSSTDSQAHHSATEMWVSVNSKALEFLQSVKLSTLIPPEQAVVTLREKKSTSPRGIQDRPLRPTLPKNVPNSVFAIGQLALT